MSASISDPSRSRRPERPAPLADAERRELRRVADGVPPLNLDEEDLRLRLQRGGLAKREACSPWRWRLTEAGRSALRDPADD
jgi:hypothetical protein